MSLMLHSPKFQSKLATYEQLAAMPEPQSLGIHHKPIAHHVLVDAFRLEIARRGYGIDRESFALGNKGAALFGVIDLKTDDNENGQRCKSFGFRNSVDQSLGIRGVAGSTVFVCDNLAMAGSVFAISRKNTTHLDLSEAVARGFDKFLAQTDELDIQIETMQQVQLTDGMAKQVIYDIFAQQVISARLFDDVDRYYFKPTQDQTDCHPRSLWGVHNACTRAMKDLTPVRRFGATVALGKVFEGLADIDTVPLSVN